MPEKSAIEQVVRAFNYISSVMMFTTALVRFIEYDADAVKMDGPYIIFTFYLVIFGILIGCAEYEAMHILLYIEFLISYSGKGLFLIFVGALLFDTRRPIDLWTSIILCLIGMFNLMMCCISLKRDKGGNDSTFNDK